MKIFLLALSCSTILLTCVTCSTANNNLSEDEVQELETHTVEVQEKIDNPETESLPTNQHRFWQKPNFDTQQNILGYTKDTFSIPEALKERVQFWIDIYTKYTTSQGILHDSKYTSVIYEPLDLTKLDTDKNLSQHQRLKAEKKYIDERKKYVKSILFKLQQTKDPAGLNEEETRYWKLFEKINDKNKFSEAAQKGRLRFQLGQRDRFIQGIFYSGRYLQDMEKVFADAGMPKELTRLPFVESSFNIHARSKVGASGIWQFMRSTGRLYMKVNGIVDQRNDPVIATHAAAKLLKTNFNMLQNWPLAVTAYNYGASGLKKIVEKYKTNDLAELYGKNPSSRFGFASQSFYTSFLAALEVEKNADQYFGKLEIADQVPYAEMPLSKPIYMKELRSFFNNDDAEIINLNPQFGQIITRNMTRIPANLTVRIPEKQKEAFNDYMARAPAAVQAVVSGTVQYKVMKGDNLYDIAKQFQTSMDKILQVNQNLDPSRLHPGQTIAIPQ